MERRTIAQKQLSSNSLTEAIQAHDLALEAIVEAQQQIPKYIEREAPLKENQSEWLSTFALFFQSLDIARTLILSAAYAPSAAILKQEWDGIYMLAAIKKGKVRYDKSPTIRNFLGESPHLEHRLLQPIAHLTGENLGYAWAVQSNAEVDRFIPTPTDFSEVSLRLLNARSYLLCHLYIEIRDFLLPVDLDVTDQKIRQTSSFLETLTKS